MFCHDVQPYPGTRGRNINQIAADFVDVDWADRAQNRVLCNGGLLGVRITKWAFRLREMQLVEIGRDVLLQVPKSRFNTIQKFWFEL